MEKLGQLRAARRVGPDRRGHPADAGRRWTSWTRPARLGRFLDGRLIRLLIAPARAGGRAYFKVVSASFGAVSQAITRSSARSC